MAKGKKPKSGAPITPELNGVLKEVRDKAIENARPKPTENEQTALKRVLELLTPEIALVKVKGTEDKQVKILREPLLMISWDRGAGAYKWAIADKILHTSVYGHLACLLLAMEGIEHALMTGQYNVKDTEGA